MGKRPAKIPDDKLIPFIRESVSTGNYRESYHHRVENIGRPAHDVSRQEVEQVLLSGRREPARDRFEDYQAWSYSIKGRTIDKRLIRVAVSIYEDMLFIVSAYAPERGEKD
ncbi:DUF4258 domain-containing protein [bacterium]|nr:DUF4258 domain-containing protein [bacterium]